MTFEEQYAKLNQLAADNGFDPTIFIPLLKLLGPILLQWIEEWLKRPPQVTFASMNDCQVYFGEYCDAAKRHVGVGDYHEAMHSLMSALHCLWHLQENKG